MGDLVASYPIEILPRLYYKKRLVVDDLLKKYKDLLAVRLVHGTKEDYVLKSENGDDYISANVFESSMANWSLNLAGGKFDTDSYSHLRFLPNCDYGKKEWHGGKVNMMAFIDTGSYSDHSPCTGLCFYIKSIHERTFPFFKGFKTQKERDEYAQQVYRITTERERQYDAHVVGAFEDKHKAVEVRGRLKVHHAPTNGNYWHITLDTYRPDSAEYVQPEGDRKSSDKTMFKALKQDLLRHGTFDEMPNYELRRRDYFRGFYWLIPDGLLSLF
jgi:hypothetical protein